MQQIKPKTIAVSLAALGLVTALGVGTVAAADGQTGTTLVDKIASRFNLKKEDVQQVFDQQRSEHQQSREQAEAKRLQAAVDAGKLTAEQRDKIVAKRAELKTAMESERDSMKDKTPAERAALKAAFDAKRAELKQWEADNGIPAGYLSGPGGLGHRGGGMRGMHENMPGPDDGQTPPDGV